MDGGVVNLGGVAYQQAQALLKALDVLDDVQLASIRIEGADESVDVEIFSRGGRCTVASQYKRRRTPYTWARADLVAILLKWHSTAASSETLFEFVTDGVLGPSGEEVQLALAQAEEGDLDALRNLLQVDVSPDSAVVRARIRLDGSTAEALLDQARRRIQALLPASSGDLFALAQTKVDALFRALFLRGTNSAAESRVMTREEIAGLLGVPADQQPHHRWSVVRVRYGETVQNWTRPHVESRVNAQAKPDGTSLAPPDNSPFSPESGPIEEILNFNPAAVYGSTGSGKSTAAVELAQKSLQVKRTVLVARAEAYVPLRLGTLVADALGAALGEAVPTETGREALMDPHVCLIIDGASEIPPDLRDGLSEELRSIVAGGVRAQIVLVGRDLPVIRSIFPATAQPTTFSIAGLDRERQLLLILSRLASAGMALDEQVAREVLDQVDLVLGDASTNPLLLSMTADLAISGSSITDRGSIYGKFVARLAERTGVANIAIIEAALGVAFAGLLDEQRRFADPIQWMQSIGRAVSSLESRAISADPSVIDEGSRRAGLIVPIGYDQKVGPLHDSFADYFAGLAHARSLAELPERLQSSDSQRVLFAADIGGVSEILAHKVASDLPFLCVRMSQADKRALSTSAPSEVADLLSLLSPVGERRYVALWQEAGSDRWVAARIAAGPSKWVTSPEEQSHLLQCEQVVQGIGGPLTIAVRLWRQQLKAALRPSDQLGSRHPRTLAEARTLLIEHCTELQRQVPLVVERLVPSAHRDLVLQTIGPTGIDGCVVQDENISFGGGWMVYYRRAKKVSISDDQSTFTDEASDHGLLDHFLRTSAESAAIERVKAALGTLTTRRWL